MEKGPPVLLSYVQDGVAKVIAFKCREDAEHWAQAAPPVFKDVRIDELEWTGHMDILGTDG